MQNSVISPRISHVSTLSKFFPSAMPGQNIQRTNAPSKSVTFSTVNSDVNSSVNVTRKNTVNVISDSVIAPVSPRPSPSSDDFTPQCYSDSLKRRKRMAGKIVSFCQDCNNVNNDHFRGSKRTINTLLKGFNNYHIKNTCFVSANFLELLRLLSFVNSNLFSDRDLAYSQTVRIAFSIAHLFCTNDLKLLLVIIEKTF